MFELQARGAPHIHCMFWLEDEDGNEAPPTLWDGEDSDPEETFEARSQRVASFANDLIHGSLEKAACQNHDRVQDDCRPCQEVLEVVSSYQCHSHKTSCFKKKRILRILPREGHGRLDGTMEEEELIVRVCRYNFPKNPSDTTCFIPAFPKDHPKKEVEKAKADYLKIRKYLLRLTNQADWEATETWPQFLQMSFQEFLYAVGMYEEGATFDETNKESFDEAKCRYLTALRCEVKSTGYVLLERSNKDIFVNNFNKSLAVIHPANHDVQFITDTYAVVEYVSGIS